MKLGMVILPAILGMPLAAFAQNGQPDYVPGEVVVKFASSGYSARAQASSLALSMNAAVAGQSGDTALLSFDADADVKSLAAQIAGRSGVKYAEANYVYRIPNSETAVAVPQSSSAAAITRNGKKISADTLKALRTVRNGRVTATYPNDPYLSKNWGWWHVGADIVSPNETPSAGVCVIDTGVDYRHEDLAGNIIKGYDFVNDDPDPMDDEGHGTHVAGIIAAKQNNKKGIVGVSTGKVVAVKVLSAQGWGTSYNIAAGIRYCANHPKVRVLNMSLGGPASNLFHDALDYAVNTKGRLAVAAAGNENTAEKSYPAGYADEALLMNKLLAVAAAGVYDDEKGEITDNDCRADYSNYGGWISTVAPGTMIASTYPDGYAYMSGTSMAAPFVAAAAARRWGYKPNETNAAVGAAVKNSGQEIYTDSTDMCWPSSMAGVRKVNAAALLDRGAISGYIYNATTGKAAVNAEFFVYQGGSAIPKDIGSSSNGYVEVINLPAGTSCSAKVYVPKQTVRIPQQAFSHEGPQTIQQGGWSFAGLAFIPDKSANFTVVGGSTDFYPLMTHVWLPEAPNLLDAKQPANFIVGVYGNSFGYLEGDSGGALTAFPFTSMNRSRYYDILPDSITISRRKAHGQLTVNRAVPYYPGTYYAGLTLFSEDGQSAMDGSETPYAYLWKDGMIKAKASNSTCDKTWWFPFSISSRRSGSARYAVLDKCIDLTPYDSGF